MGYSRHILIKAVSDECVWFDFTQLHRSQHGNKWFDCEPCHQSHGVKEHFETAASKGRRTTGDGDKFVALGDVHKNNDVSDKKNSIHRKKKSGDGDKSRHKSTAAGRKTKKIGM